MTTAPEEESDFSLSLCVCLSQKGNKIVCIKIVFIISDFVADLMPVTQIKPFKQAHRVYVSGELGGWVGGLPPNSCPYVCYSLTVPRNASLADCMARLSGVPVPLVCRQSVPKDSDMVRANIGTETHMSLELWLFLPSNLSTCLLDCQQFSSGVPLLCKCTNRVSGKCKKNDIVSTSVPRTVPADSHLHSSYAEST